MKRALFARAAAAAALSASIALPALAGVATGTANAKPRQDPNCLGIGDAVLDSYYMYEEHRAAGNTILAADWLDTYQRASRNYARLCS